MVSPAKRRKKNDFKGSDRPVRSLDYFFAKQKDASKNATPPEQNKDSTNVTSSTLADSQLTDEELARKLQEEWNNEVNVAGTTAQSERPSESQIDQENNGPDQVPTDLSPPKPIPEEKSVPKNPFATLTLQSTATAEDTITTNIPFDENPLTFDPSKYISKLQGHWAADGGRATYALLTRCFILVNSTTSRIKIVDTLVNLLRTIIEGDPQSLLPAVWLATNSISPPYIDLELGLGGSAISKALKKVCGLDNASLKTLYNKYGDAGDVAFEAKKRQSFTLRKPKPLTIAFVFDSLVKIARSKGTGSVEAKQRLVERLLQDSRGAEESRYIVRTLVQHLRIGAVKTTMLIALSRAFLMSRPMGAEFPIHSLSSLAKLKKEELTEIYSRNEETVKACFARRPNYNDLVPALLEIGGRDFSCEYKYDGQRAQVHCDEKGKVTIFSRHLEVMTDKYPDLVALVPQMRGDGVSSFIMEGEVVAIDRETGELKTFQTLANRARKDVVIGSVKIDVCLFAFDLMYLNGEELLGRTFRERRELLRSLFTEIPHHFTWVKSLDATSADQETVSEFFKGATANKCEGIMVKVLDNLPNPDLLDETVDEKPPSLPPTPKKKKGKGTKNKSNAESNGNEGEKDKRTSGRRKALLSTYEPDKRVDSWLKVKKDYNTSADTIDLIPVGGWHGQGRKNKWWSPILLAVRNPETGMLEAVTKCMSGFTDKFYAANRAKYDPDAEVGDDNEDDDNDAGVGNTRTTKPAFVEYAGTPAVWFEPQEVWECAFADITLSPTYTAAIGLVSEDRGLSLRFPRFLRVREDKGLEEASTSDFLADLWRKQEARAPAREKEATEADEVDKDAE
ncbi:uncharacterized protein K452DRAFT_316619 [Aplosporella prunicola CBS 121167]|uniref:DNA ligase n=1 Tax=Aplosporella prunicola CBS 121167 TaxID=1176127 RepID=A0A6A6BKW2_9PEZI|nr:uncharacterized protein K452DRAFT_316619 [Aplosporella prunicola CBS 121167]KAF2144676.1 hypothetical protein K452DRAFT_316619 [Aplosporella prunicola CBS 121167]